jgi:hypothetical protein
MCETLHDLLRAVNWLAAHLDRILTAYRKAATMHFAVSGFRATGILPYNSDILTDVDLLANAQKQMTVSNEEEVNQSPVPATQLVSPREV